MSELDTVRKREERCYCALCSNASCMYVYLAVKLLLYLHIHPTACLLVVFDTFPTLIESSASVSM